MTAQYKDYYEILEVEREAGDEELRRAFRRLARRYHPDVTGNDRSAEDRFKEINEAYEVLGDPSRRARYDEFTQTWRNESVDEAWRRFARPASFSSEGRHEPFTFTGAAFSDFFQELFGARGGTRPAPDRNSSAREIDPPDDDDRGSDLEADIAVTLDEVATGAVRQITLRRAGRCDTCFGVGQYNAHPCEKCRGSGSVSTTVTCKVKIPRGVREGTLLRIPERGEEGKPGAAPGDLYLKVRYAAHVDYTLEGGHLVHEVELAPWEAVLGTSVSVPTLFDGEVKIRIPPGTQSGRKLRVRGKGLPDGQATGDLFVKIKVQVPVSIAERERRLWEDLARESSFKARGQ